jgi:hypothetical protein
MNGSLQDSGGFRFSIRVQASNLVPAPAIRVSFYEERRELQRLLGGQAEGKPAYRFVGGLLQWAAESAKDGRNGSDG